MVLHQVGQVMKRSMSTHVKQGFVGTIGETPLIELFSLSAVTKCRILAKAEFLNPGGSVKDRAALSMIVDAEKRGLIHPNATIVEGTAGNTGIGLAHICNARGYDCIIYVPNTQSQEKLDALRILGAHVRPVPVAPFTDPKNFNHQAKACAESLTNAFWTNQFDNLANKQAHYATTGPEIWKQTQGKVDAFVAATGTGGTLAGTGTYLREQHPGIKIFLADPPGSVLYSHVKRNQLERTGDGSITEGIGQGRITENMKGFHCDDAFHIPDAESIAMVYHLLHQEGIFVGASSALNVVAACKAAEQLGPGHTIVTLLCDGAHRYQSRLFSRSWLESKNLYEAVPASCRQLVSLA